MDHKPYNGFFRENLLLFGISLSLTFWFAEALLHSYIFEGTDFYAQIIPGSTNEFWMRLFAVAVIMSFSLYARSILKQRTQALEGLLSSERRYMDLIETAEEGVWGIDAQGNTTFINRRMAELLGCTVEEMQGRHVSDFCYVDWHEAAEEKLRRRSAGIRERFEFLLRRKDDGAAWVIISAMPEYDGKGNYAGALALVTDITGLKRTEFALRDERDIAKTYLDIVPVIVLVVKSDQTVESVNRKGCEILGLPEKEIKGRNWFDHFLPPECRDETRAFFEEIISGRVRDFEYRENTVLAKDGLRTIGWHNSVMRDSEGRITATLSAGEDVTERRKTETAMKERVDELERFMKITVQREIRMKELRDRIIELEQKTKDGRDMQIHKNEGL